MIDRTFQKCLKASYTFIEEVMDKSEVYNLTGLFLLIIWLFLNLNTYFTTDYTELLVSSTLLSFYNVNFQGYVCCLSSLTAVKDLSLMLGLCINFIVLIDSNCCYFSCIIADSSFRCMQQISPPSSHAILFSQI